MPPPMMPIDCFDVIIYSPFALGVILGEAKGLDHDGRDPSLALRVTKLEYF